MGEPPGPAFYYFGVIIGGSMQENSSKTQESQRAYVRVIDYIKQEIRVGNLRIGSRLPSERALAEQLNVGRNSVREALRILEIMGTTVSTQGAGHFIAGNFESSLVETMSIMFLLKELSFQQVSQLRYAIEKHAFALAVENATDVDLTELQAIISRLDLGLSEEENVLWIRSCTIRWLVLPETHCSWKFSMRCPM